MKAAALALLLAAPARADWTEDPGRPAYRAIERLSDGAYSLLRGSLFSTLLPGRLTREMGRAPTTDSYAAFRANFSVKQDRAARRVLEARPAAQTDGPSARAAWLGYAREEQTAALRDALLDTLVDRYGLETFGRRSGAYASDRGNWEPGFLASSSVLGSAYLWAAGVDAGFDAGPARLGLQLAPGWRWRSAVEGRAVRRLARVETSRGGASLYAEWDAGSSDAARVGASLSRRF